MQLDYRKLKEELSVEKVLDEYGLLRFLTKKENKLYGSCPIHVGDNPRAFNVDLNKNLWNCFTHCGGGTVIDLIMQIEDSDGESYYCPITNNLTESNLNIRDTSFSNILDYFKRINKSISVENIEECDLEYLCGGGCRLNNLEKRRDYLKPEPCEDGRKEPLYQEMTNLRLV